MTCGSYLPAQMNRRVSIQSATDVSDGQGGQTASWATDATVYAAIEPLKGYEKYQAMQVQTPVSHKVTIRYRAGVTTSQRLLYGSRIFGIKEVINVNEDGNFLELKCIEQA
jgi:SPP1 family predicted phage head-tail adaptor